MKVRNILVIAESLHPFQDATHPIDPAEFASRHKNAFMPPLSFLLCLSVSSLNQRRAHSLSALRRDATHLTIVRFVQLMFIECTTRVTYKYSVANLDGL